MIGLVYVGKVIDLSPIEGADFILSATVVCGKGGKWRGVVKKEQFQVGDLSLVYLPDAVIPPSEEMKFMESSGWRVRMRRFKGAPSEVVIMPLKGDELVYVGYDATLEMKVTKYHKPVPANLQGKAIGEFPSFIPKTDELNYQRHPELVEQLQGHGFYISEKMDGSSTTAYKYKGHFGICSRNWELEVDEDNGYWKIARKYKLEEKLPEGLALQWETCGPKIQSNPMGLKEIEGYAFSAYDIEKKCYLKGQEFMLLCGMLNMPFCKIEKWAPDFRYQFEDLNQLAVGSYPNGVAREGIVIRSIENVLGHKPISFKVINLDYKFG